MRKILLMSMSLAIGLSFASPAVAQTLAFYLAKLSDHPSVLAGVENSNYLEHMSEHVSALPDPQVIFGVDNIPVDDPAFDRYLPSAKVIGIKQSIPNGAVRLAKSEHALGQSRQQRLKTEYQLARLKSIFIKQLIELNKVKALKDQLTEQLALYQLMENDLRGQLEAGRPVYGRFSGIDVERSEVEAQFNVLRAEAIQIEAMLIELVGSVPKIIPPTPEMLPWQAGKTTLYPTQIMAEGIKISDKNIELAQARFKPNYGLQAIYKQRESGENFEGDDWFSLQATISVPLWRHANQTPALRAAQAQLGAAQSNYEYSVRHWAQKMESLSAKIRYSKDNVSVLEEKISSLGEVISAAQRNYEAGNVALEVVLGAQINRSKIAAKLIDQRSQYQGLIAEFNSHIQLNAELTEGGI